MATPGSIRFSDLSAAYQKLLLDDATNFAERLVRSHRWRSAPNGVLPEGYDPSSLAAEAIAQLCTSSPRALTRRPRATRRRLPSPAAASVPRALATLALSQPETPRATLRLIVKIRKRLRRLIRTQINRLHRLKENRLNRNEPDLSPETLEDGDQLSPIAFVPGTDRSPPEILIAAEDDAQWEALKAQFIAFLGKRRPLVTLFNLLCAGIRKPGTLARKLGVPAATVRNLHDQLKRQFWCFKNAKSVRNRLQPLKKSPEYFLDSEYFAFAA